jgi:hypothetical protein
MFHDGDAVDVAARAKSHVQRARAAGIDLRLQIASGYLPPAISALLRFRCAPIDEFGFLK